MGVSLSGDPWYGGLSTTRYALATNQSFERIHISQAQETYLLLGFPLPSLIVPLIEAFSIPTSR